MNISDIKLKNKTPIAFIIPKEKNNMLIDLNNRIVNPNINGDYILPNTPYLIIRKYNVQNPELRVINFNGKNIDNNNEYINTNMNNLNQKIIKDVIYIMVENQIFFLRKFRIILKIK